MQRGKKKLENWLPKDSWFRDYLEAYRISESPRSFFLFSSMSMLGAAIGRKMWMRNGIHTLYPMLNLLLIGPSGLGKSTAAHVAFRLIEALPEAEKPQVIQGATMEKLHKDLAVKPHAVIFASELAAFFGRQKYLEGLIPYITSLVDCNKVERATKSEGRVVIEKPEVTIVGCSTVDWLQGQLPDTASTGGFLPRFLIVNEEHKAQKIALPGMFISSSTAMRMAEDEQRVMERFKHLVLSASGSIGFRDYGVADTFSTWYTNYIPASGHLAPFAERAREFVLRMSMLLAVSCHRPYIVEEDVQGSIALYEYAIRRLQEVVVPLSLQGRLLNKVLQALSIGSLTPKAIRRAMRNDIRADEADRLIQSLMQSGDIERLADGKYRRVSG